MIITHTSEILCRIGTIVPVTEVLHGEWFQFTNTGTSTWGRIDNDLWYLDPATNIPMPWVNGWFNSAPSDEKVIIIK